MEGDKPPKPPRTRLDRAPLSDADLTWYYCEAHAAMGDRSNFGSIIAVSQAGVRVQAESKADASMTDHRLRMTERMRRIEAWLSELSAAHQEVLELAYGQPEKMPPPEVRHALGRFYPLVPRTRAAKTAFERAQATHPKRGATLDHWLSQLAPRSVVDAAKREAEAAAFEAFEAFARARGAGLRRFRKSDRPAETWTERKAAWAK